MMSTAKQRRWLKATGLALGLGLLVTLFTGCGEGQLPPIPPKPTGTVNLYGEAV